MKVIFLDFDGVINNWHCFDEVDYNNTKVLLTIIKSTNAKIVVTSSTKYSFQRKENLNYENTIFYKYIQLLKEYGIETFEITPYLNENREQEILAYLKEHPEIDEFLILDDDYVIGSLKEHQIFLELYKGLTEEHIKPAINILNGILGFYPQNFDFTETTEQRMIRINEYYNNQNNNKNL